MKILNRIAPHAAIVLGNMYYVFWGIDRVNKSMNFIDNGYTKLLLVLLIASCALTDLRLRRITLRQLHRSANPAPIYVRLGLLAVNALLSLIILILLVVDLFKPDLMLFLSELVKAMILTLSITGLLNSLLAIARDRMVLRALLRREAQARAARPRTASAPPARRYSGGRR